MFVLSLSMLRVGTALSADWLRPFALCPNVPSPGPPSSRFRDHPQGYGHALSLKVRASCALQSSRTVLSSRADERHNSGRGLGLSIVPADTRCKQATTAG